MEEKVLKYISVPQVVIQKYSIYRIKILDGRQTCMCTTEFLNNGASVRKKVVAFERSCVNNVVYVFLKIGKKSFYLLVTCYKAYTCTLTPCGCNYVTHSCKPNA